MHHLRRYWPVYAIAAVLLASWLHAFIAVWNAQ